MVLEHVRFSGQKKVSVIWIKWAIITEQRRVLDGFKNGGSLFPQKPTVMFQITLVCGFMCLLTSNEIGMVVKFCNCPHCLNLETE